MKTIRISSGVTSGGTYGTTVSVYASGSTLDIVMSGGVEILSNGGVSDSTYLEVGANEDVLNRGVASGTVIGENDHLLVSSGGVAYSSTIHYDGELIVQSGGKSINTIDKSATEIVNFGGVSVDGEISEGGQILLGGKSIGTILIVPPGFAQGAVQYVYSGGIASATKVRYKTSQFVGGYGETASTGDAIAYNTIDRGTQIVDSSGVSRATVVSGGTEYVYSAGVSSNTNVFSKGTEYVSSGGVAIGTTVYNGGTETKKFSGGTEIVASGGITSRTTIEGGRLEIEKGGKAAGLVTFSGTDGKLIIDAIAMPTATISGFAATDSIVLSAIPYATSDSVTVNAENIVTISAGGKTYNLHIAGATIGETDFSFGPGSILTRAAPTQPSFLRPPAAETPAENILAQTPVLTSASLIPAPTAAAASSSATHPPAWQPLTASTPTRKPSPNSSPPTPHSRPPAA